MADEEMTRAEEIAKRASELAARAEDLAHHAHEVAGVDEQLAKLEAELDALMAEEEALDAGVIDGQEQAEPHNQDSWPNLAESLAERMEALGDRLGDLISGTVDAALDTSFGAASAFVPLSTGLFNEGATTLPVIAAIPVSVRSRGGNVVVRSGRPDQVRVSWRGRGRPTAMDASQPVSVQERDGVVVIESAGARGWRRNIVAVEVEVPVGSPIEAVTGGGSIRIEGTNSAVRARTGGGSITIADVNGEVDATSGGGSIQVEGRLSGQSSISTGGGSIDVALRPGTHIDIEAAGTMASIDVPGLNLQGYHVSGSVAGGGDGHLRVRTGGGRARISQR